MGSICASEGSGGDCTLSSQDRWSVFNQSGQTRWPQPKIVIFISEPELTNGISCVK